MAKVTPKENFMMLAHGGHPEYVPVYTMMGIPYLGEVADAMIMDPTFTANHFVDGGYDMWGVRYVAPEAGVQATMPDTSIIMLEDIADWSKVIKFPKPNDVDYDRAYKEGLEKANIDRTQTVLKGGPGLMPFQELVAMMGFEGGLMALYTDPEEVKAMLNAMVDHIEPYFMKMYEASKPDMWYILDDTCAKQTPFFSPEIYEDVFLPIYKRLARPAMENDIPVVFHNCGYCEPFMEMMTQFNVQILEPTQESNDIMACKERFKGKMSFCGGWDWDLHMPKNYPEFDEEEIRQGVRDAIDKNCKGGAYGFAGGVASRADDAEVAQKINLIVRDEAHWSGRKVYGYTGE
ncbi:MAG: uroporphyrinogen decarboxylase family protein [Oscillospiraceae bacterium]|nr:uroporphyrinogen decarboxylase family protein [Oscillospiraceae bacterium]